MVPSRGAGLALSGPAAAQDVLFENVRIFDGSTPALSEPSNVLVQGNAIAAISPDPIAAEGATRIAGGGRTLMPGLIDAHWHAFLVRPTPVEVMTGDVGFTTLVAGAEATDTLMRGFTTVRDMGGPVFGLKQAIDAGIVVGPRIYPSGAMITVTSGHGDFRQLSDLPRTLGGPLEPDGGDRRQHGRRQPRRGAGARPRAADARRLADQADRRRRRLLAAQPARRLDLHPGGTRRRGRGRRQLGHLRGGARLHPDGDPAGDRGGGQGHRARAPDGRGHRALMAEQGIWLSTQPFLDDATAFGPDSDQAEKKRQVVAGTDTVYALAKKHGIKTAFGTDILFSKALADRQGARLAELTRWYTPAEALAMATSANGELLQLTGLRNPYPGRLGVVEEGALADLLLVDGNPLEDIDLIADPATNFRVIMKDGMVYKNSLAGD